MGSEPAFPPPPTPAQAPGEGRRRKREYMNIPGIVFTGICNADGLGEAGSGRASPAPDSEGGIQTAVPAPSGTGREEPEKERGTSELGSFCTTGTKSLPPLNRATSATELLHRRCHAAAGGDAAPATYRNIKVLLSCRVNSSNALSKG